MKEKIETGIRTILQDNKDCVDDIFDNSYGSNRYNIAHYYVSIDIGKKNYVAYITDKEGLIIEETRYSNTLSETYFVHQIYQRFTSINCIVVVESTANMWIKTYKARSK